MGVFCRICGRVRANESFTGRGHRDHVCRECQDRPSPAQEWVSEIDELHCFLGQSNISARNIARLHALCAASREEVRQRAAMVLEIALVHPRKRRRLKFLVAQRWDLFARMHALLGAEYFYQFIKGFGPHNDWLLAALQRLAGINPNPFANTTAARLAPSPGCEGGREAGPDGSRRTQNESPPQEPQPGGLKHVTIHTDGACRGNPGPGGWAAVLRHRAHLKELAGGDPATTNNRMELTAAIEALGALKMQSAVDLFTDSAYLRNGVTQWLARWKVNGWRTIDRKPVKNEDLWRRLDALCGRHRVRWHWLKGHAGHSENERCDRLARAEISKLNTRILEPPNSLQTSQISDSAFRDSRIL